MSGADAAGTVALPAEVPVALPEGEFAIVELFGHTTLVGRIREVEMFGAKMMAVEPLFRDTLLPAVFHGGAAIYRLTPCSAAVAWARQPRRGWELPEAIRCIVPPLLIEAGQGRTVVDVAEDDDGGDDGGDGGPD